MFPSGLCSPKNTQLKATEATRQPAHSQKVLVVSSTENKDSTSGGEDSDDNSSELKWKDSSRLPDFGLLRLTPDGPFPVEDLEHNLPLLNDAETVLLMEVKRLVKDSHVKIMEGLTEAKQDLEVQAAYVFSRGTQTSVIAVAAAGDRYEWATLMKNPRMPSCTPSEDEDPTWTPHGTGIKPVILKGKWSSHKRIISVEADADWEDIKSSL